MEYINRIELQGRIGHISSSLCSPMGSLRVYRFSLLTEDVLKTRDGHAFIEQTWHNVALAEKYPEELSWLEKGMMIHITGRLRNSKYINANGEESRIGEVWADDILIVKANKGNAL